MKVLLPVAGQGNLKTGLRGASSRNRLRLSLKGEPQHVDERETGARHSWRRAIMGSTRVARRAGTWAARVATVNRRNATAVKVVGSAA
jgi:hypothetical protein